MNCNKIILLFIGFLLIVGTAYAIPSPAAQIYGYVYVNNLSALPGTLIEVKDVNNTLCGNFTVVNLAEYGLLSCNGDDPDTLGIDEGAVEGETISFYVNGQEIDLIQGDNTWYSGEFLYLNLSPPVVNLYCGDNICSPDSSSLCFSYAKPSMP